VLPTTDHDLIQTFDGRTARRASLLTRGVTIAVDLSLTVGIASLLFYLLSLLTPLDTPAARAPVGGIVALAFAYLVIGRDLVLSPGRRLFGLELARLPGNVPGLMGRRISVYAGDTQATRNDPLPRAMLAIVLATALSGLCLAASLTTTRIYAAALEHLSRGAAVQGAEGPFEPGRLPRALLVGITRGYVQLDVRDGQDRPLTLAFYLTRQGALWRVDAVEPATQPMTTSYSLGVADDEVPRRK
jgi:hypothetical protein